MGIEIERKFLVHKSYLPELKEGITIIQGYLSEKPSVRFRIIDNKFTMGIKDYYAVGERFELETPSQEVTVDEITKLQELAISPPITKVRHNHRENELLWEIDIYKGENLGLVTADVELPSIDYPIRFPVWVDKQLEITNDIRYTNLNLGRHPYTKWT